MRRPPCLDYGDVDGNGQITEKDARLVSEYVVGLVQFSEEQLRKADVNADGVVDIRDAMMIAQYAEGKIDSFPICQTSKVLTNRIALLALLFMGK